MAKTFTQILESGPLLAPVGAKSTLVNTGNGNIFLTTDDTDEALNQLPYEAQTGVLNSIYSLAPGQSKSLSAGSYNLALGWACSAVLLVEKTA